MKNHTLEKKSGKYIIDHLLQNIPKENEITAYISGPITSFPELNKPSFDKMEKDIKITLRKELVKYSRSINVINPFKLIPLTEQSGKPWEYFMKIDIAALTKAHFVIMLPQWRVSTGAIWELLTAKVLNIAIFDNKFQPLKLNGADYVALFFTVVSKVFHKEM